MPGRDQSSRSHRRWLPATAAWLVLGLVAALATTAAARASTPERVVVVGDIHGAYDAFVGILQATGLIDADLKWTGGDTVLVQTGDIVDKGPDIRPVMDLLMALQEEAPLYGGRVVVLMGNHEAMNITTIVRDTSPEAYAAFADAGSKKRRQKVLSKHERLLKRRAAALDQPAPVFDDSSRKAWLDSYPAGRIEYMEAMSSQGRYGRWIRQLPLTARVGSTLFIHAGIPPDLATASLAELNAQVRADIETIDETRATLVRRRVILPSYSWTEAQDAIVDEFNGYRARGESREFLLPEEKEYMLWLANLLEVQGGTLTDGDGPLWYRGFARGPEEESRELVEQLLETHDVDHIASGHTPQRTGEIVSRFDGRLFLIDTGMLQAIYKGRASALEFQGGRIRALYAGEQELLLAAPPPN